MNELTYAELIQIHTRTLVEHNGLPGIKDEGFLLSALAQPSMSFGGDDLYPSLPEKAAALGFSLVKNHAFNDGNKRVSFLAMAVFLYKNGYLLEIAEEEVIQFMLDLAAGKVEREELVIWIEDNIYPNRQSAHQDATTAFSKSTEWQKVDTMFKSNRKKVSIDFRTYRMPIGKPITLAFKELNSEILEGLSDEENKALLELARFFSRSTKGAWTFACTRIEEGSEEGLIIDKKRLKIVVLAIKPGALTFFKIFSTRYGMEKFKSRQAAVLGLEWGKQNPHRFFVLSAPLEDKTELSMLAESHELVLSRKAPSDPLTDTRTQKMHFAEYPMQNEPYVLYLDSSAETPIPQSQKEAEEIAKIERMFLGLS